MKIHGNIDGVFSKQIVGWVYDTEDSRNELIVEAKCSNGYSLHTIANILREDLVEANIGNGRCGYIFDISELSSCDIDLFLLYEGKTHKLNEASIKYIQVDAEQHDEEGDQGEGVIGNIDIVNSQEIIGWACNKRDFTENVMLTANSKNGKSVTVKADIYRSDVKDAIGGSGNYGFVIKLKELEYCCPITIVSGEDDNTFLFKTVELDPIDALLRDDIPPKIHAMLQSVIKKNISELESTTHD